jgi:hypothetical protein
MRTLYRAGELGSDGPINGGRSRLLLETHEVLLPFLSRIVRVIRIAHRFARRLADSIARRTAQGMAWRRARKAFAALAALAASAGFVGSGCRARPAPGGTCRVAEQTVCSARDRALVCEAAPLAPPDPGAATMTAAPPAPARTWTPVPCKGARGCGRAGDEDECDDTLAVEGDACPRSPPLDYACATTLTDALVCKEGRFDLWRHCRGPKGCRVIDGRNVHCDTSLGEPDDPCERAGTFACSVDGKTMLACDGKVLVAASSCRGPKACFFASGEPGAEPHDIDCDDGVAVEGDPCTQARRITCATDRKAELACDGHQYKVKRECRRSDCRIDGTELFCD